MTDSTPITLQPGNALVTGAAKRIGRAIALDLASAGWNVAIHYRESADEAASAAREVQSMGRRAVAVRADLTREAEVLQIVPQASAALGPLTCLVNSASTFVMDDIRSVTRASWDQHIETNLRAPLVLSQAFAAQLPEQQPGAIINMLDERVWKLTPYFLSYTVAKCGLWTLTQTLALALAPRIRVNGIGPGPTLPSPRQSDEQFRAQWDSMPLKRGTTPAEI
ncbi:MAG TPA: SDR family oxidoreductase, partial [Dongiaceae bacterium]